MSQVNEKASKQSSASSSAELMGLKHIWVIKHQKTIDWTDRAKSIQKLENQTLREISQDIFTLFQSTRHTLQNISQLKKHLIYDPFLLGHFGSVDWVQRIIYQKNSKSLRLQEQDLISITRIIGRIFKTKNRENKVEMINQFARLQISMRDCCHPQSKVIIDKIREVMILCQNLKRHDLDTVYSLYLDLMDYEHYFQLINIFIKISNCNEAMRLVWINLKPLLQDFSQGGEKNWSYFVSRLECGMRKIQSQNTSRITQGSSLQNSPNIFATDKSNKSMIVFMKLTVYPKVEKYSVNEKGSRKVTIKTVYDDRAQLQQSNTDSVLQEIQNLLYKMEIKVVKKIAAEQRRYIAPITILKENIQEFVYAIPIGEKIYLGKQPDPQIALDFIETLVHSCLQMEQIGLHYADFSQNNCILFIGEGIKLIDFDHVYDMSLEDPSLRRLVRILLLWSPPHTSETYQFTKLCLFKNQVESFEYFKDKLAREFEALSKGATQHLGKLITDYEDQCLELMKKGWKESHLLQVVSVTEEIARFRLKQVMQKPQIDSIKDACKQLKKTLPNYYSQGYQQFITSLKEIPKPISTFIFEENDDDYKSGQSTARSDFSSMKQRLTGVKCQAATMEQLIEYPQNEEFKDQFQIQLDRISIKLQQMIEKMKTKKKAASRQNSAR